MIPVPDKLIETRPFDLFFFNSLPYYVDRPSDQSKASDLGTKFIDKR